MAKAVDKAYQAIRALILGGAYQSGARLKEEELAERVGVSRTPVREALRRLDSEQLIKFIPNHGAYVSAWSRADLEEIFLLRSVLEATAIERAAALITPAELDQLEALQKVIETASFSDPPQPERVAPANYEFHRILLSAARSARLTTMMTWLMDVPQMLGTYATYTASDFERSIVHHREIIFALRARDGQWAASIMRAHQAAARHVYLTAKFGTKSVAETGEKLIQESSVVPIKSVRLAS